MDQRALLRCVDSDEARPRFHANCVDCPAARVGCFEGAVGDGASPCRFVKATLSARAQIPVAWAERYAFALVRRGVLIRTRAGGSGPPVSVDCAGPGALVPWPTSARELGYAATDVLVCLYARDGVAEDTEREPSATRDTLDGFARALDRVERLAEARGQSSAEDRVARVLAVIADTLSPPVRRVRLPSALQQRDLARLAGVRHESFCRILGKLERAGVVQRSTEGLEIARHDELLAASA